MRYLITFRVAFRGIVAYFSGAFAGIVAEYKRINTQPKRMLFDYPDEMLAELYDELYDLDIQSKILTREYCMNMIRDKSNKETCRKTWALSGRIVEIYDLIKQIEYIR